MSNPKRSTADLMLEEYFSFLLADELGTFTSEETERVNRFKTEDEPAQTAPKTPEFARKIPTASAIETKADQLISEEIALWAEAKLPITKAEPVTLVATNPFDLELKPYAEPEEKLEQVQRLLDEYATKELTLVRSDLATQTVDQKLQKLMQLATTPERKAKLALYQQKQSVIAEPVTTTVVTSIAQPITTVVQTTALTTEPVWENVDYGEQFQVLYFIIHGVKFAAPLIELGVIQLLAKLHQAVWRPKWSLGLMMNAQDETVKNIEVIDSARWAMSHQLNDDNSHRANYRYVMRLNDSRWGLALDDLIGSSAVRRDQVNWRTTAGKRPWLAGIIKDQMCVLLHVGAMIKMFEQGLDISDIDLSETEQLLKN